MVRVILHVGMPKTATTTIQHTLEAQSLNLLKSGVLLPKTGRVSKSVPCHHSLFLPVASSKSAILVPLPKPYETFESMQQKVDHERKEACATSLILSSEILWNPVAFDRAALTRIRDAFRPSEFVIFAYLRPLENHALSGYAQRVTGPQCFTGSFKEHISKMMEWGVYNYDERLSDFECVFGRDAIRPVWLPWLNRDVLSPFREIFPEITDVAPVKDLNVRKSWLYVAAKRWNNVLHRTPMRRLGSLFLRLLGRFDRLAKNSLIVERIMDPMDAETERYLENRSKILLEALSDQYHMREM